MVGLLWVTGTWTTGVGEEPSADSRAGDLSKCCQSMDGAGYRAKGGAGSAGRLFRRKWKNHPTALRCLTKIPGADPECRPVPGFQILEHGLRPSQSADRTAEDPCLDHVFRRASGTVLPEETEHRRVGFHARPRRFQTPRLIRRNRDFCPDCHQMQGRFVVVFGILRIVCIGVRLTVLQEPRCSPHDPFIPEEDVTDHFWFFHRVVIHNLPVSEEHVDMAAVPAAVGIRGIFLAQENRDGFRALRRGGQRFTTGSQTPRCHQKAEEKTDHHQRLVA